MPTARSLEKSGDVMNDLMPSSKSGSMPGNRCDNSCLPIPCVIIVALRAMASVDMVPSIETRWPRPSMYLAAVPLMNSLRSIALDSSAVQMTNISNPSTLRISRENWS